MKVLLLVDLQNDFLTGGSMPVPQGESIIPLASQLEGCFKLVVATQQWHPTNHKSFAASHTGRSPGEVVVLKKQPQRLLPIHCVQNTRGAELASNLMLNRVNKVVRRGTDAEIDDYSGFFDAGHNHPTGLHEYLRERQVKEVFVLGFGLEAAVQATVLDAISLGFRTTLIEDACRDWEPLPETKARVLKTLTGSGAIVIQSQELLAIPTLRGNGVSPVS